jgi:hypothetical protein
LFPSSTADRKTIYEIGTVNFKVAFEQMDEARQNAALVIWYAISIEQRINTIIANYLFGSVAGQIKPNRDFFINHILNADIITFHKKKGLLVEIASLENIFTGKDNDKLTKLLADTEKYRNAFAHGRIIVDTKLGPIVHYFSNGHKHFILNDEFWEVLEKSCQDLSDMLRLIDNHLENKFLKNLKDQ